MHARFPAAARAAVAAVLACLLATCRAQPTTTQPQASRVGRMGRARQLGRRPPRVCRRYASALPPAHRPVTRHSPHTECQLSPFHGFLSFSASPETCNVARARPRRGQVCATWVAHLDMPRSVTPASCAGHLISAPPSATPGLLPSGLHAPPAPPGLPSDAATGTHKPFSAARRDNPQRGANHARTPPVAAQSLSSPCFSREKPSSLPLLGFITVLVAGNRFISPRQLGPQHALPVFLSFPLPWSAAPRSWPPHPPPTHPPRAAPIHPDIHPPSLVPPVLQGFIRVAGNQFVDDTCAEFRLAGEWAVLRVSGWLGGCQPWEEASGWEVGWIGRMCGGVWVVAGGV